MATRQLLTITTALLILAPQTSAEVQPTEAWSDTFTNESYFDDTISIGSFGTQLFNDSGLSTGRTRLYAASALDIEDARQILLHVEHSSPDLEYLQKKATSLRISIRLNRLLESL